MSVPTTPAKKFGIDVDVDNDIQQLSHSSEPLASKVETLINLLEEMHVVTRDNNAIFVEMLFSAEKKLNKRIDDLREELIGMINTRTGSSFTSVSVNDKINKYKTEESTALDELRTAANASPSAKGPAARVDPFAPPQTAPAATPSKITYLPPDKGILPTYTTTESVTVTPMPGFVIKTKRLLGTKEKAFINVFHHPQVELEPANLPKNHKDDKPYIVIDDVTVTADKEGNSCLMYNIAVSSEYFRQPNQQNPKIAEIGITTPFCVQKIIRKVNLRFSEYLDEGNYVLPRLTLGYKGDAVPTFTIPVEVKHTGHAPVPTKPPLTSSAATASAMMGQQRQNNNSTASNGVAAAPRRSMSPTDGIFSDIPHVQESGEQSGNNSNNNSMYSMPKEFPPSRYSADNNDSASVMSDITHDTIDGQQVRRPSQSSVVRRGSGGSKHRKPHRKSFFDTSALAFSGGDIAGRNMLHGSMLEYIREECVDSKTATSIKEESVQFPDVLLGWQINIDPSEKKDDKTSGIYVVTDMRRNLLQKLEFRISRYHQDDQWVKLRRVDGKGGYAFRPMRKVLFGLTDDEDNSNY